MNILEIEILDAWNASTSEIYNLCEGARGNVTMPYSIFAKLCGDPEFWSFFEPRWRGATSHVGKILDVTLEIPDIENFKSEYIALLNTHFRNMTKKARTRKG